MISRIQFLSVILSRRQPSRVDSTIRRFLRSDIRLPRASRPYSAIRMDFRTGDTAGKITDILSSVTYSQYNQIIAQSYADIWAGHDKYNIIADWRYMKYPSTTFGFRRTYAIFGRLYDRFQLCQAAYDGHALCRTQSVSGFGLFLRLLLKIREVNPPPGVVTSFEKYGLYAHGNGQRTGSAGIV